MAIDNNNNDTCRESKYNTLYMILSPEASTIPDIYG